MEIDKKYDDSHLEAIENYYYNLLEEDQDAVTLSDVIVSWFTEGYAEKFREAYLKNETTKDIDMPSLH